MNSVSSFSEILQDKQWLWVFFEYCVFSQSTLVWLVFAASPRLLVIEVGSKNGSTPEAALLNLNDCAMLCLLNVAAVSQTLIKP